MLGEMSNLVRSLLVITALSVASNFEFSLLHAEDAPSFPAEDLEFFEKQVRPLLVNRCAECHSGEKVKGGLRLNSRAALITGGDSGAAIVPGKPEESELILAVSYDPAGYQMPPKGKLPDNEIAILAKWVKLGAPWPETDTDTATDPSTSWESVREARAKHWSFQPLAHPEVPNSFPPDLKDWSRNDIDRFILAKLSEQGLKPATQADRRVWLRRAAFDITGLPPTPDEIEAFVADESATAYEKQTERLMASPHFGERWGRHWLDLVRYAESRGHEFDYDVANPWHYRDYVIRALNDDLPYDRFVVEHVAGDLLPSSEESGAGERYVRRINPETGGNESILATGFWFFGEWVHSPVDIRQEEAERFENMIDVYSKTFLRLTVDCARCHDHKFDPISAADFYALQGYLQSSSYRQVRFESMEQNARVAEQLVDVRKEATPVLLRTLSEAVEPTINDLDKYLLASREAIAAGAEFKKDANEIVFADFESGTYDDWTTTGDAFGDVPQNKKTIADYQGDVKAIGKWFVNSHVSKESSGQGDKHVGTLTSKEFKIERSFITLLVGGGAHKEKTCVNLIVDGKVVRSVTGQNSNQMSPASWDVSSLKGQSATIQLVDKVKGAWGNIGVDQIVFTNHVNGKAKRSPDDFSPKFRRTLIDIAQHHGTHINILGEWVVFGLSDEGRDDPIMGHWWKQQPMPMPVDIDAFELADAVNKVGGEVVADYRQAAAEKLDTKEAEATFIHDGETFGTGQRHRGDVRLSTVEGTSPVRGIVTASAIERDRFWDSLEYKSGTMQEAGRTSGWNRGGRVLRTPTFQITQPKVFALVRGGVRTYASVDSHITINGPLHGSLLQEHGAQNDWHWISHDVKRYIGHGMHLEFIPRGEDNFAVAMVIQAERSPQLADEPTAADQEELNTAERLANWYRNRFASVLHGLYQEGDHKITDRGNAEIADWIVKHPELVGFDDGARQRLTNAAKPFTDRLKELQGQIINQSATAPAMLAANTQAEYVFVRGNWKKQGDIVPPRFLEVFGGQDVELKADNPPSMVRSDRMQLALEMVDPERTPIMARVIVNRIWLHYFGRGLVPTPDDFGHLGQEPSHPELLDWLAQELIAKDWSLKHIHRLILASNTYRMSSDLGSGGNDPSLIAKVDPGNKLLHRMNVKRLEGEVIRDAVLALSGRLDETIGGPSVPVHLTPFMEGRGRPSQSGPIDGNGRRSLYLSVRRNFAEPFFQAFDFPNPHSTIGRRSSSNVPSQALALMNNPLIVEQSQVWAERMLSNTKGATIEQRVARLYEEAFSRSPSEREQTRGVNFVTALAKELGCNLDDVRLWKEYAHVLLNAKEFIFVR